MKNLNINDFTNVNIEKYNKIKIDNNLIPDLRVVTNENKKLKIEFPLYVESPDSNFFKKFHLSNLNLDNDLKNKLKIKKEKNNSTKLFFKNTFGVEMTYLLNKEIKNRKNVSILDMGCGNGENEEILYKMGATNVILTDYYAKKAHLLTDVHDLPFKDESFDIIFTSQAIEHFYNPFLAFREMSRILKNDGVIIGSASFMERWHGNSFFHCSPNALYALCKINSLEMINFWHTKSGWMDLLNSDSIFNKVKIIHFANMLNFFSNLIYLFFKNKKLEYSKKLYTSQSFGFLAKKNIFLNQKKNNDLNLNNRYSRTNKI